MTAKIITIAQQKGGAGKTTLTAQLAVGFSCARLKVATIDIDPQGSLTCWTTLRNDALGDANAIAHVTTQGWRLRKEIERLRNDYDIILIDSPPHTQTDATIAVREADLVLVPVQPSALDIWACGETLKCAAAEHVPAIIVMNRVNARASLYDHMRTTLSDMNLDIATTVLGNRVTFAASIARGLGVAESEPSSNLAVIEVFNLVRELKKHKAIKETSARKAA